MNFALHCIALLALLTGILHAPMSEVHDTNRYSICFCALQICCDALAYMIAPKNVRRPVRGVKGGWEASSTAWQPFHLCKG